jgi:LPS export ABC transporter protein LptC
MPSGSALFSRKRLRLLLGGVLVLALAGVGLQLLHNRWMQRLRSLRTAELDFLPEVAQRIQNFRRVKMDGDRKEWEVAAREAQYFEDDHEIVVTGPEVSFYLEDGEGTVSLRGEHGRIRLDGREMDRVELEGGIEVHFQDYLVRTDRAVYERAADTVVSPAVTISGNGIELRGGRMTIEMGAQTVRLDGKVATQLRGAEHDAS